MLHKPVQQPRRLLQLALALMPPAVQAVQHGPRGRTERSQPYACRRQVPYKVVRPGRAEVWGAGEVQVMAAARGPKVGQEVLGEGLRGAQGGPQGGVDGEGEVLRLLRLLLGDVLRFRC